MGSFPCCLSGRTGTSCPPGQARRETPSAVLVPVTDWCLRTSGEVRNPRRNRSEKQGNANTQVMPSVGGEERGGCHPAVTRAGPNPGFPRGKKLRGKGWFKAERELLDLPQMFECRLLQLAWCSSRQPGLQRTCPPGASHPPGHLWALQHPRPPARCWPRSQRPRGRCSPCVKSTGTG